MAESLYSKMLGVDYLKKRLPEDREWANILAQAGIGNADEKVNLDVYKNLPGFKGFIGESTLFVDWEECEKCLMKPYESNPVFSDAMNGRLSIEESLKDLARIRQGMRVLLPWRKNRVHNDRLSQIGELVTYPHYLRTSGIFFPDNIVTATVESAPLVYAMAYGFFNFLMPELDPNLVSTHEIKRAFETTVPWFITAFTPLTGLLINQMRFTDIPIHEAKFLDDKIREHYRN
jgi:hypothetical protein